MSAASYYYLDTVYYGLRDLEKAKEYYLLALEMNKEQLSPKYVAVANS